MENSTIPARADRRSLSAATVLCRLFLKPHPASPLNEWYDLGVGRVFATKGFDRWSKNHEVEDAALIEAIEQAEQGLVAANLGGGLVKLRVARSGGGKSGGYRTIVALAVGERAIYLHGFAKNDVDNIDSKDLTQLKQLGNALQRLNDVGDRKGVGGEAD